MKRAHYILSALLLLALLAGCGPTRLTVATATPMPVASPTPLPSPTRQPGDTPTPKPTATWVPTVTAQPTIPTATPQPPTSTPALSAEVLATMDAIETEMEELRALTLSVPITRTLMTREELGHYLDNQFTEDYPPEEVEADVKVMAAFDFAPEDFDLRQALLDLYSSQILGLYDDELDTFFVVTSGDLNLLHQLTIGHEYVHALQDQNLNLDTFVDDDQLNEDEILARLALVEGDASLAMAQYLLAHMSELTADDLAALQEGDTQGSEEALNAAPPIIRETFLFPYVNGLQFVSLLQQEGWDAVDAAFADPPQSTEQILHPDKYFSRDEPQIIALPPLTDTLGTGWHLVEEDTLGEFQTRIFLAQQVDQEAVLLASQGWDGDRYAVYTNDGAALLVFATVWDSPEDGDEFVAAYRQYAEGKYAQPPTRATETELWWETPTQTAVLTWEGHTVVVVLGPDAATVVRVLARAKP